MGLNRMMMKSNKFLKDITAEMVVGFLNSGLIIWLGFIDGSCGKLSPNPLPNGVHVSAIAVSSSLDTQFTPTTIKSCTFEEIGVTLTQGDMDKGEIDTIGEYLRNNINGPVPITFHF